MRVFRLASTLFLAGAAFGFQEKPHSAPGTVTGRVIEANSGDPAKGIRKALVVLRLEQERAIGAYSDDKGEYRVQAEPGIYVVTVERDGYVSSAQSQSRTITVREGQTTESVDLELTRTGAISGRVLDFDGEPLAHVNVQLLSARGKKGGPLRTALTDDRGAYRIFQIRPGKYHLVALYQPAFQQGEVKLRITDGSAEKTYAATYFPGTSNIAQALEVDVPAGAEIAAGDIQLRQVRAVHVGGHVSGMPSAPVPVAMISLRPAGSEFGATRNGLVGEAGGEFDLSGVLPGKYELSAESFDVMNRGPGPSARRTIEVGQADVDGVELTMAAPETVSGRIVVPEGRRVPQGLLVMLSNQGTAPTQQGGLGEVASDGAFTFTAVPPGDYDVELGSTGPGDDLYVGAIRRGDEDVLSHSLHVNGRNSERLEIVLKATGGTVDVVARTSKGEPLPDASVALLPDPPRREQAALFSTCATNARGACTLRGVAPGDYHAYAVSKDASISFRDPSSTKDLEKQAAAVKIAEGDHVSLEVEVARDDR